MGGSAYAFCGNPIGKLEITCMSGKKTQQHKTFDQRLASSFAGHF